MARGDSTVLYKVEPRTAAMAIRRGGEVFRECLFSHDRNEEGYDLPMAIASVYLQGAQDAIEATRLPKENLVFNEGAGI